MFHPGAGAAMFRFDGPVSVGSETEHKALQGGIEREKKNQSDDEKRMSG
jgi:hypothetical protein